MFEEGYIEPRFFILVSFTDMNKSYQSSPWMYRIVQGHCSSCGFIIFIVHFFTPKPPKFLEN